MSLSSQPAFNIIKNDFVCGFKDIENKGWAGASRKHMPGGQSIETTNGAGPHNIQIFMLAPDGTVLHCLPGYWRSDDLARELDFSKRLYKVYMDQEMTAADKNTLFAKMQLAHIREHPKDERERSHLQGFDLHYEKEKNPGGDVFYQRAINPATGEIPDRAVKTTDIIMHERMAQRPFLSYDDFDVAAFSKYGKPMYDKEEDFRMANGEIAPDAKISDAPMIGNDPRAHPFKTEAKRQGKSLVRSAIYRAVQTGVSAAMH